MSRRRDPNKPRYANPNAKYLFERGKGSASPQEMVKHVDRANGVADEELPTMTKGQIWFPKADPTLYRDSDAYVARSVHRPPMPVVVIACDPLSHIVFQKKTFRVVTVLPLIFVSEITGPDEAPILLKPNEFEPNIDYAIQLWNPHRMLFHNFDFKRMLAEFRKNSFQPIEAMLHGMYPDGVGYPSSEQERLFGVMHRDKFQTRAEKDSRRINHLDRLKYLRIPIMLLEEMILQDFQKGNAH